ncbi:MAG: helix-turn-helix transcriptional regulator [Anaerolineae bacterium]|jgi:DNA-binding PadR family transcriptional regulator|nr:helix-turn-helix transcriptional regulator [Anaerolineae bacterium]
MDEIINNLILELRRGTLMLSVLSQLRERQYGYSLKERLAEQGIEIDQGTLYPLLRRLEKQGLLDSEWDLGEARPRRYYTLSAQGQAVLTAMIAEWRQLVEAMERVLPADNR